jgi:hypothetical protein
LIEIQSALLEAVQAHALGPDTAIGTSPPLAGTVADSGATVNVQPGGGGVGGGDGGTGGCGPDDPAACWVTLACAPATDTVPTRGPAALAATVNRTLALPLPEDGVAFPIQSTVLCAVHEQPGMVVRAKETSDCDEPTSTVGGASVKVQGAPC